MRYTDAIEENGKLVYAPKRNSMKIIIALVVAAIIGTVVVSSAAIPPWGKCANVGGKLICR